MSAAVLVRGSILALLAWPGIALAAEPPGSPSPTPRDSARIGAGADTRGRVAVNQAAGSGNAQINLAAIAFSADGTGVVELRASQHPAVDGDRSRAAHAQIDGDAFAGSHGVISINQAAGSGNAQANLFAVGRHPLGGRHDAGATDAPMTGLGDAALAAVAGEAGPEGTGTTIRIRQARIADDAFRGSHGVVQVNQTAGVGNLSTNAIVLQLPGSTP